MPATPPPELLGELDTAAGVLSTLDANGLELRLSVGKGALEVTLQTVDGTPVRTIPHRQLLDALAGNGLGIALDEQG